MRTATIVHKINYVDIRKDKSNSTEHKIHEHNINFVQAVIVPCGKFGHKALSIRSH